MAELVEGAVLGVVFQLVYKGGVCMYKVFSGSARKELEKTVKKLLPTVKEICETSSGPPSDLSLPKFQKFHDNIIEGNRLVDERQKSCICLRTCRVAICVKKLEKDINEFIRIEHPLIVALQQIQAQNFQSTQLETVIYGQNFHSTLLGTVIQGQNSHFTQLSRNVETVIQMQNSHFTQLSGEVETLLRSVEQLKDQRMENLLRTVEQVQHTQISEQNSQFTQPDSVTHGQNSQPTQLENMPGETETLLRRVEEMQHTPISLLDDSNPPDLSPYLVGFDDDITNLKELLLKDAINVVGIAAIGGAGKSTLAKAFCNDGEIRDRFKERIIYIEVSDTADFSTILETMLIKIGGLKPHFTNVDVTHTNVDVTHNKLDFLIKLIEEPTLMVLDDIWSKQDLEKLLFEGKKYKTLVTTRDKDVIPKGPKTRVYELPLLHQEHSLSLLCHYAFGEPTIPIDRDKELIIKVQQQCNGLPLALKVIGTSLYGKPDSVWSATRGALATGESADNNQRKLLLKCLETSINGLNPLEKQCFLDLAVFPRGRTIPANVLLDIWVYVRRMGRDDAVLLLRKFGASHLLDLRRDPGTPEITDDCMDEYTTIAENPDDCMDVYCFSQHDVMRDLALSLAEQDNEIHFSRMYMPQKGSELPKEWQTDGDQLYRAQIVSIHTGAMKDTKWPQMEFPVAEALVLYFTASEYCIPTFLHTMKKLKVLIIHNNDGAKRSKLSGVTDFGEFSQLKTLHLAKVTVPEECKVSKSLEKIYMSLCEGLGRDKTFIFPGLLEFNVSYCIDLEELPVGLCSSLSLKKLSVTHCHRLAQLPDELGKLGSLEDIRLFESPGLTALPSSICNLQKLKFLDISSCIHLKVNRWRRCELKETLQTVAELPSLKRVICDKNNGKLFKSTSRTDLKVHAVVEEEPNLDWLDLKDF